MWRPQKGASEGVYTAALRKRGLGVALKIDDGAARASEVALIAVLHYLGVIDDAAADRLAGFLVVPLINRAGRRVGEVRAAAGWPQ